MSLLVESRVTCPIAQLFEPETENALAGDKQKNCRDPKNPPGAVFSVIDDALGAPGEALPEKSVPASGGEIVDRRLVRTQGAVNKIHGQENLS